MNDCSTKYQLINTCSVGFFLNRSLLVLLLLVLLPMLPAAENADASSSSAVTKTPWTLLEVKKMAVQNNPTMSEVKARIDSAAAEVARAKSAYWPSLDLNSGVMRNRDRATRPNKNYDNNTDYSLGLGLSWTVFDGFQRKFSRLVAEYGLDSAIEADFNAQRLLLQAAAAAFLSALRAQDGMAIAQEDADFNRILLEDAKKREEGGVATLSEVLNFELQVGNAEVDFITAEQEWKVAIIALGALLAVSRDALWESIELQPPPELQDFTFTQSELLDYARQNRPDLKMAEYNIAMADAAIEAAKSSWYPRVDFFADYGFAREDSISFNKNYDREVYFGIAATWNIFNGFRTTALLDQARAERVVYIKIREEVLLRLEAQIRQHYLTLQSSKKQLALQENILSTAKRIRDLVHHEYLGGTATITRLNEVQSDVTISASARSKAYIQVFYNLEELLASTGKITDIGFLERQE